MAIKTRKNKLISKNDLMLSSLKKYYYNQDEKIERIKQVACVDTRKINKKDISLRIIEWFVTNYSKKYGIAWIQEKEINGIKTYNQFNVFLNYKSQLNAYSKKQFDPFCRRNRINFIYNNNGDVLITTIGQLNFFRWALDNEILEYVEENHEHIEHDMNNSIKQHYNNNNIEINDVNGKKRKKRNELSKSASRRMNIYDYKITLSFN